MPTYIATGIKEGFGEGLLGAANRGSAEGGRRGGQMFTIVRDIVYARYRKDWL